MSYAICIVPVAPIRSQYDHRAEMSSQLIFGEQVKVMSTTEDGWARVEACTDGYIGCCRMNQFLLQNDLLKNSGEFTADWVQDIMVKDQRLVIPMGADLSILKADLQELKIHYNGNSVSATDELFSEENINRFSAPYLNTAYLWGGRSVFGIDCSGFAQAVFKMMNIGLPRDANQQVNQGEGIGFLQEGRCGDLAFFDDEEGRIVHVGILLNAETIIHASGNVRIDSIDNEGIIHSETGKRTHHLRVIKRIATYA
ncbi:MAG: NlpC/P60 family protein [Chitinophagaceae bacterium]|nr:MAG: NlpC/P60 family protein [Chitinophagaceae bacterium]